MSRILVTGAGGFIGAALVKALGGGVRTAGRTVHSGDHVQVAQLDARTDWRAALDGVDAVVHLAGPAHARVSEAQLAAAVTDATAALAAQAEAANVGRFVFVSSLKASRARTHGGPVSEAETPAPEDGYGRAKLAAERAILAHATLRPVILRPPLVHAPDARANFALLMRLAGSGAPLPFASVDNKRSLIARASLIEAIKAALGEGPSGVFHVTDQPALSTPQIITALRRGLGLRPNLFRAPALAALAPAQMRESLESDDHAFRAAYGYGDRARGSSIEALEACGAAYRTRA